MRDSFHHERLYRGEVALAKLAQLRVTICGAGAVGSNLINTLARQGVQQITVIDFDRVEDHNIGTQTYTQEDVGLFKVEAIQAEIFRAVGVEVTTLRQKLTDRNVAKLLKRADLVIDGFDNHAARLAVTDYCRQTDMPCLHVGLSADYAEILWNTEYRVPRDPTEVGLDICDYPLARNLIQFAVTLASEAVIRFVLTGVQQNYSFTLQDLRVNQES
ncbi:MAG: ThiF family adenylyltransferase [Chloroflexota bacterium]